MSLFKTSGTGAAPAPLTRARLEAALRAQDWKYRVDSDGDVGGVWDGNFFYFFLSGTKKAILNIQSRWRKDLPPSMLGELVAELNEWHRSHRWPKAYAVVKDPEHLLVLAELQIDWETGVTDEQLKAHLMCGIATSLQLFGHLEQKFSSSAR
jgi:hypothetical protein